MILQALTQYYNRLAAEGKAAPMGFKSVAIPFLIVLNRNGEFAGLEDTRTQTGKKLIARTFIVPEEQERSGLKSYKKCNLLWDHYGYVLAWPKTDSEADRSRAQKQHKTFLAKVKDLRERFSDDKEIEAVYRFLSNGDFRKVFSARLWPDCAKIPGCNLSFRVDWLTSLVCENGNVRAYVHEMAGLCQDDDEDSGISSNYKGLCLVTGTEAAISRLHPRTPIPGAKNNAKIVSFQKNSGFDSYGREQSYNAPVSKSAAFAYTTAINYMLRRPEQRIQVGDATTIFWAEKKHDFENVFSSLFGLSADGEPEQDYKSLIAMFLSPYLGAKAELEPSTKFYVLGLAPNAARISIRFWYVGSVKEVADNIYQYFQDIDIVHAAYEMPYCSLNELLASTAVETKDLKKTNRIYLKGRYYDVMPNFAGEMMRSILSGTPYPQNALIAVLNRIKADQSKKDQKKGKPVPNVTYARAALIKAILTRESKNKKEVGMSLDTTNTNPGYLLGRLFAILEKVQEESAGGWGEINSTIRDRFYASASSTPMVVFPHLMKLNKYHLAKLRVAKNSFYEKLTGEVVNLLEANNPFSPNLTLQDQGRFAVGYYHQRQSFFNKKGSE